MTRYRQTADNRKVPFTEAEEAEADAREAAAALPAALAAFKAKRNAVLDAGATSGGHVYDADRDGQSAITSAVVLGQVIDAQAGQGTYSVVWKTRNGNHTVNLAGLVAAGLAIGTKVGAAYAREAVLAALANGGDVDQALAAINDGWPS